jgi:hypothetical protein
MTTDTYVTNAARSAIAYLRSRGKYCLDKKVKKIPTQREFWRRVSDHLDKSETMELMAADPRFHGPDIE